MADCTSDVRVICAALGIDRLAMLGTSGGGPHVLACAALLAYLAGFYRFKGVEKNLFPRDTRKPAPGGPGPLASASEKRPQPPSEEASVEKQAPRGHGPQAQPRLPEIERLH